MKRRGKILIGVTGLLGIALFAILLNTVQQRSAEPFPGAVVVLDGAAWRGRAIRHEYYQGYEWLAPESIFTLRQAAVGLQVVRQTVRPGSRTVPPPEPVPNVFTKADQWVRSLSPDGKTLCIAERSRKRGWKYLLMPLDGKTKPVMIDTWSNHLVWSLDSRALYGTWWANSAVLQRYDAQIGTLTQTKLQTKTSTDYPALTQITPDGRMLCFKASTRLMQGAPPTGCSWTLAEIQQGRLVEIAAPHIKDRTPSFGILSPTGDRILWETQVQETSFLQKLAKLFKGNQKTASVVQRWEVCDTDGKNWRTLGTVALPENGDYAAMPRPGWTPDGKGIHFVNNGKLCYLDLPK